MARKNRWIAATLGTLWLANPASHSAPAEQPSDREIARAIDLDLLTTDAVASDLLDIACSNGVVTLTGTVDNLLAKQRAEVVAQSMQGALTVINRLTVKPVERTDDQIQTDVQQALLRDPAADSYEIRPEVDQGIVTLRGQVQSFQEYSLAEQLAKGVKGVQGVENRLRWLWKNDRADMEVRADILSRLRWDASVHHELINVDVDQGRVTLRGAVGSAIEKSRAMADAWVAGSKSVDAARLEVRPHLRDQARRLAPGESSPSDEQIQKAVQHAFLYDPRVFSYNTSVEVTHGVVTLEGTVENLKAKRAAASDAANTRGVWRVVNLLKVRPTHAPPAASLTEAVQQALAADPYVSEDEIAVRVVKRKAELSGRVDSLYKRQRAQELAEGIRGIVTVQNNLTVDPSPASFTDLDYYAELNHVRHAANVITSRMVDARIETTTKARLAWNPYVSSNQISVTVHDGVATLRGTVDNLVERGAAIEAALQAGALGVRDELEPGAGR